MRGRVMEPPFDDLARLSLYGGGGGGAAGRDHGTPPNNPAPSASAAGPTHTPTSARRGGSRATVRYTAFLLDDLSRCSLLDWMRELGAESPSNWVTHCDHVTIHHSPSEAQLTAFPFGIPCEMRVLGAAGDERARAVHVDVPDFVPQPASAVRACGGDE